MIRRIFTINNQTDIDTTIYKPIYESIVTIDLIRKFKIDDIDEKTDEILKNGFIYDEIEFGFTMEDQLNYLGLYTMRDCLQYPTSIKTKIENDFYTFENSEQVALFAMTACGWKQNVYQSGWDLKSAVIECQTITEICNIEDLR